MAVVLPGALLAGYGAAVRSAPHGPTELAPGVTFEIAQVPPDENGAGRLYLARAWLDPATLDLFVTPPDPTLSGTAYTHRLAHTAAVARRNALLVATNGPLFLSRSGKIRRQGEPASIVETTVCNGQTIHWWEHAYMLGFFADLTPDPTQTKPPDRARLAGWKWGFGSQVVRSLLDWDPRYEMPRDRYSVLAVNAHTRELGLAVFTDANLRKMGEELRRRGFEYMYMQDGSESATIAVRGQAVTGDWRPVPSHDGIRLLGNR